MITIHTNEKEDKLVCFGNLLVGETFIDPQCFPELAVMIKLPSTKGEANTLVFYQNGKIEKAAYAEHFEVLPVNIDIFVKRI